MDLAKENKSQLDKFEKPEKAKENICILVNTIQTNKNFSKLIVYSLNTLKNMLNLSNHVIVIENANNIYKGIVT